LTDAAYLIRLSVKPDCIEPFRAHTLELMRAASLLPRCERVQLLQGDADPSQFVLLETWTDQSYYLSDEHQQADYRTAYFEATKTMLRDVSVELLRPVRDAADGVTGSEAPGVAPEAATDAAPEAAPAAPPTEAIADGDGTPVA
jgi:quinol monooxygenase YgiN